MVQRRSVIPLLHGASINGTKYDIYIYLHIIYKDLLICCCHLLVLLVVGVVYNI